MQTENTKNDFQKQSEEVVRKSHNKKVYFTIVIIFTAIAIGLFLGIVVIINDCKYLGSNKNIDFNLSDNNKIKNNQIDASDWQTYKNKFHKDYEIKHPSELTIIEKGQDKRAVSLLSEDYKLDMTNGAVSGFVINIFVNHYDSFDNLFKCNKKNSDIYNCLLADSNLLLDYKKGEIIEKRFNVNGYPAIKYEFISGNKKNNGIGIVAQKEDKFYVLAITYRKIKKIELFNQILSTFKFIEEETFSKNYDGFTVKGNDINFILRK